MVSNTNELHSLIKSAIESISVTGLSAFYGYTKEQRAMPYAEFTLKQIGTTDGKTQQELEVNVFAGTRFSVEEISDKIQDKLDHEARQGQDIAFYSYKNKRDMVEEDNKNIQRVRLTFELYSYSTKEGE